MEEDNLDRWLTWLTPFVAVFGVICMGLFTILAAAVVYHLFFKTIGACG